MRSQLIYYTTFTVVLNLCLFTASAQMRWQSGLFMGGANYQGDLLAQNAPILSKTGYALGLVNYYHLNPRLSVRNHLLIGRIMGSDRDAPASSGRSNRNFSFESNIGELALMMEWQPLLFLVDSTGSPAKFSPYIYGGIGLSRINTKTSFDTSVGNGFLEKIEMDKANNNSDPGVVVPLGGGIKFNISPTFDLGLDIGARLTFSDYVDGVSASGNPESNDWYWFGGIIAGLRFSARDTDKDGIIDKEDECPKEKGGLVTKGCPDKDSDGVGDKDDLCPDVSGDPMYNGCPDSDGDTIVDILDDCPDFAGPELTNGCPDEDLDQIPDKEDLCPRLAGDLFGKGCPPLDANANGTIKDEIASMKPSTSKLIIDLQQLKEQYSWANQKEIWALIIF